jgi:hypothetical protein
MISLHFGFSNNAFFSGKETSTKEKRWSSTIEFLFDYLLVNCYLMFVVELCYNDFMLNYRFMLNCYRTFVVELTSDNCWLIVI